jgi:hypothetical protein
MSVLSPADVALWLPNTVEADLDTEQVQLVIDAVEAHLAKICDVPDLVGEDEDATYPADFRLGALMLIAREMKRAETPSGTMTFDGVGVPISGFDSDISRFLADYEKTEGRFG